MALLKWIWAQEDDGLVDPYIIYYTLRLVMFVLSFVLEDWAVHDLVRSPRHRPEAVLLVCSSYVTWTFQTHTFSNSVETLLVLWSLVVIERIVGENVSLLLSIFKCQELTVSIETISNCFLCCPGLSCRLRHLQSNYISNFHRDTRHPNVATFSE